MDGVAMTVNTGDDVAMQCAAEGSAELQYEWFQNGRKLQPAAGGSGKTAGRTFKNNKSLLTLTGVGPAESGTYTCSARNGAGPTRFNHPLVLSVGPRRLVRFHKEVIAAPDTTARLLCAFEPAAPSVEWLFRGQVLSKTAK